jgi:hypothetical protein
MICVSPLTSDVVAMTKKPQQHKNPIAKSSRRSPVA